VLAAHLGICCRRAVFFEDTFIELAAAKRRWRRPQVPIVFSGISKSARHTLGLNEERGIDIHAELWNAMPSGKKEQHLHLDKPLVG